MKALGYDDIQLLPRYSEILHRSNCKVNTMLTSRLEIKTPITSAPMKTITEWEMAVELGHLGGIGFIHRFMSIPDQATQVAKVKAAKQIVGAAIEATGAFFERAEGVLEAGADVILIDVAHGHHKLVRDAIAKIKQSLGNTVQIIAGNVCTMEGAKDLRDWGADAIRVGIAAGSMCTTGKNTATGCPQATAIRNCVLGVKDKPIPIIADGSIKWPGDVAKALALGASTVMIGSLFAGTFETPGNIIKSGDWPSQRLTKRYAGSASLEDKLNRGEKDKHIEGVSREVDYRGKVGRIFDDIIDGLKSAMSYANSLTIEQFQKNAQIIEVSISGAIEMTPHGLLR